MATQRDLRRYLTNLRGEVDGAAVYAAMATHEKDPELAKIYAKLGRIEEKHARFWEKRLLDAGHPSPPRTPSWRARILIWSAKHWGADAVLPRVAALEAMGQDLYVPQVETAGTGMTREEHEHARVLTSLLEKRGARGNPWGGSKVGTEGSAGMRFARRCSAPTMACART